MNLSPEFARSIADQFLMPRGYNANYEIHVIPGNSKPYTHNSSGYTEWKNGKPKRYQRARYRICIGIDWLKETYPIGFMNAQLHGHPFHPDWRDEYPKALIPYRGYQESLDPVEDDRLYA